MLLATRSAPRSGIDSRCTTRPSMEAGSIRRKSKSVCSRGNVWGADESPTWGRFAARRAPGLFASIARDSRSTGSSTANPPVASLVTGRTLSSGLRPRSPGVQESGRRDRSVLLFTMANLFEQLQNARVYDLGQPYFTGMPHYPTHPPFLFGLTKKHGEVVLDGGVSSSADAMALGTHVGTHIDALCHFSCGGKVYGGVDAASNQSHTAGMNLLSVDTIAPILRRGVLLDIAGNQ